MLNVGQRFEDMVEKNKEDYDAAIAKLEKQRNASAA